MKTKTSRHRHIRSNAVIYDVLHGFIPIAPWEEQIINSPFFQRLRWIKQLGFSNYIFPGAEHNRFAHVIGVMHSMHQMISSLGLAASEADLFDRKVTTKEVLLHRSLRVAALLHDIGTFPFSHAIENAYIRHGNDTRHPRQSKAAKNLPNSHEHLGSFIIKNTDYEGGLTRILNDAGLDVQLISKIIKGESPYLIANQLMHSDLDADRMDYLMRDSHYTGIKYGQFDREYILANLVTFDADSGQMAFGVRQNAVHAVEDFLIARFGWYSQVIKNPGSAKFDIMSSHVAQALLQQDELYQFPQLLEMVEKRDSRFFWWNDIYFMHRCQELLHKGKIHSPHTTELTEMLLYRRAPKTVQHPLFAHRILQTEHGGQEKESLVKRISILVAEMREALKKHGRGTEWILVDIPHKDVVFTSKSKSGSAMHARDPIKVVNKSGRASLLAETDNALMKHLGGLTNFVPSVYANDSAIQILRKKKLLGTP